MAQSKAKAENAVPTAAAGVEDEIAYLAKRHRVTPAIVRAIILCIGRSDLRPPGGVKPGHSDAPRPTS